MANTPKLTMPYLVAGQAQKEITHNDALNDLDALAQISVINRTTSTPPVSPAEGDSYIIGATPTGAWAGNANAVASYYSGWRIKPAKLGWFAFVQAENMFYLFDGSVWNVYKPNAPVFSVSASQTLTSGSNTKAALSTVAFDTHSIVDTGTNRVQPTLAGYYQFNANIAFSAATAAGGSVSAVLYKNGSAHQTLGTLPNSNTIAIAFSGSMTVNMNGSSDYVEVFLLQSSGANQSVTCNLSGALVRAL